MRQFNEVHLPDSAVSENLRELSDTIAPLGIDTSGLAALELFWSALEGAARNGIGGEVTFVTGVEFGVLALHATMTLPPNEAREAIREGVRRGVADLEAYTRCIRC